jgi:CRISPR system Cascade subunit CasA
LVPVTRPLGTDDLHPLAIEICRRVRIEDAGDGLCLRARGTGTKAPRVAAKDLRGVTGDPWAPVGTDDEGAKVLSVTAAGFGWELMRDLLIGGGKNHFALPLLAKPVPEDGAEVELRAAALARGQGKTEGFHTRSLTVRGAAALRALSGEAEARQRLADLSQRLSGLAMSAARQCFRPALFLLFQKGPAQAKLDRSSTAAQVAPWMVRFDRLVDRAFFDALWPGLESEEARAAAERAWIERLHAFAGEVFEAAADAAPSTDQRRILAAQRARDLLRFALRKHLPLPEAEASPETSHVG